MRKLGLALGVTCDTGVTALRRFCIDVEVLDDGIVRMRWSFSSFSLDLGIDKSGCGYGGTGVNVNAGKLTQWDSWWN